jgi:hypothetical protein
MEKKKKLLNILLNLKMKSMRKMMMKLTMMDHIFAQRRGGLDSNSLRDLLAAPEPIKRGTGQRKR